jgi:hypothetical protein
MIFKPLPNYGTHATNIGRKVTPDQVTFEHLNGNRWSLLVGADHLQGGVKVYCGSAAAARHYVEADRGRADDYYLAEGTGIAKRYKASHAGVVTCEALLAGDAYEAWVAGFDPQTGVAKGRLRNDANAVRFVEVSVNGPKSWSLAAELHPDISAAYDAAQDAAAMQIIGWLAQHATTRVGPRGGQIQIPVAEIDAVTVRHYTSRAGDPHRHLHLQINARVLAEGQWRGLHTVGVRDSIDAVNGIGHAAMMTDPGFRQALAEHGFTLDLSTGEVVRLAEFVGPFSVRAAQIGRHLDAYEADWRLAHPHTEPGPALWRAWDRRAWSDARPDKIVPRDGTELTSRWVAELHALGYRQPPNPTTVDPLRVGQLDRDTAAEEVLSRLGARRSGWNTADVRGEVERLIARAGVVTEAPLRIDLAEDLMARTVANCVPLIRRLGVPEHVRALTSEHVLEVESDLTARLGRRAKASPVLQEPIAPYVEVGLDPTQRDVVRTLAGGVQLVVIEGAAGAGKTMTLAAARTAIERHGVRLRVATPTLKAAHVAARQVGGDASSAAWLAYEHGFRWHDDAAWSRLRPGDIDPFTGLTYAGPGPNATLSFGDLLLVDEAGMLDQDTARALLTIADEHHARVALVGDRHQLPAIGRGGVLDLAVRQVHPDAHRELDVVHRFTCTVTGPDGVAVAVPDEEYARLTLTMRNGDNPGAAFDTLMARGQIRVHRNDADLLAAVARDAADARAGGVDAVVVADTNDQVSVLNAAVRAELVASGRVDDTGTVLGRDSRIGTGDQVVTRTNNGELDIANRDRWTVTGTHRDGAVAVTGDRGSRVLPPDYVRHHTELGYATTIHGVQGETATIAHLVVGDHTSAASGYVGMTRGRSSNIAHVVADSVDEAREQWVAAFARDRADLGPAHAARLADREAARYAPQRPLAVVLDELRAAWTVEADSALRLDTFRKHHDDVLKARSIRAREAVVLPRLRAVYEQATATAAAAQERVAGIEPHLAAHATQIAGVLKAEWAAQRPAAREAADSIRRGPGCLGVRRGAVRNATKQLTRWADSWAPYLPDLPDTIDQRVAYAAHIEPDWAHDTTFDTHARAIAERDHSDYIPARVAAQQASDAQGEAANTLADTRQDFAMASLRYTSRLDDTLDLDAVLDRLNELIARTEANLDQARDQIQRLRRDPALRSQPTHVIDDTHADWITDRRLRSARRAVSSDSYTISSTDISSPALHPPMSPAHAPSTAPRI